MLPDFRTIADFRCDNRAAFKAVFRAFVMLCRKLDLFGRELLAVDGARLKAANSRSRNFSRERLATYLAELDQIDRGGSRRLSLPWRENARHPPPLDHARACHGPVFQPRGLHWRRVNRWEKEHVIERMAERLEKRPDILIIRSSTLEHPFGTIKQSMNQDAFLMRGLENVRAEFSLTALAYNMMRATTPIGGPGMIRAVQA